MGKKQRRKQKNRKIRPSVKGCDVVSKASAAADHPAAELSLDAAREAVLLLIGEDKTKAAVELAKSTHKRIGSEGSEALLAQAYAGRIRGMLAKGMGDEARALLDLVRSRHPNASDALDGLALDLAAQTGNFDGFIRPLADPDLPAPERLAIEDTVRRRTTDLQALAECGALPPEHPLRRSAHAAWTAFEAVTSGAVADEVVDLPEISRRSPLAPWKSLIRAIACFYSSEDEDCRRHLRAIDTDTPPARLVPVLEAMLGRAPLPTDNPHAQNLMKGVVGNHGGLRELLEKTEHILAEDRFSGYGSKGMKAIRAVARACAALDGPTAKRIQRHLWVKAFGQGYFVDEVDGAFLAPVQRDAAFWSLLAQSHMVETEFSCVNPLAACAAWDEFRCQAIHEGSLPPDGPGSATVYRLMLKVLGNIPRAEIEDLRREFFSEYPSHELLYRGQPKHVREGASPFRVERPESAYFLYPEKLYARIVAVEPSPALYREWLAWNGKHGTPEQAGQIMDAWAKAFPRDAGVLLLLMEAAEKRGAYKKALGYLAQAEALNALDPEVRRACLRLHMGAFERHFKQGKAHLAAKDLDAIEAIPPLDGQDRRAVEAALRASTAIIAGESKASEQFQQAAAEVLEDALAAEILCWGVAKHLGVPSKKLPKLNKPSVRLGKGVRAAAVARANALAKDMGISLPLPPGSQVKLRVDLRDHAAGVDTAHLKAFSESLLDNREFEMAYYATRGGLLQEGDHLAQFLYLRAKALSGTHSWRRLQCISAAVELARDRRQFDVIDAAIDFLNADPQLKYMARPDPQLNMDAGHLHHVIAHERQQKKAPEYDPHTYSEGRRYYPRCKCAECQEGRRYRPTGPAFLGVNPFGWGEEDVEEDLDGFPSVEELMNSWDPFGGELPEELEVTLNAIAREMAGKGFSPKQFEQAATLAILNYLKKHAAAPSPENDSEPGEQGGLFDDIPF